MLNLVRAEIYKLNKSISLKICFLLSCISGAALIYISHCIAIGSMSTDVSGSASGLTEIVIISLLGSLMTGILVCSDFETKTIHDSVTCGNGRWSVVISKALIFLMIIALLLTPYMLATIIGFCSGVQFTKPFVASVFIGILSDSAGAEVTAGNLGKIIAISLVTMLVHAARISICIPFAFKIRKSIAVLTFGFVFDALISLVISLLVKVKIFADIISFTPFESKFLLLTVNTTAGILWKAVISSILFIGLMAVLAYKIFKRADIK